MGSILLWLGRGLYLGGGAIIGLMFEKISTWVAGLLPSSVNVEGKDGKLAWWFITAVSIAAGIVLYVFTKAITGKKKIFTALLFASVFAIEALCFGSGFSVVTASLLFSVAASSPGTASLQYCPEFITFNIGTVPSAFQIEVVGVGVVFNLDGTGITNMNGIRAVGTLPTGQYIFQIANGYISKNTTFKVTNAHAAQLDIYGSSDNPGTAFIRHNQATAFANTQFMVPPFLYAAFPSAAATDQFTITWNNAKRTIQTMTRLELVSRLAYNQQVVDTRYNLDNYQRQVASVQFLGDAEQTVYYQDVISA